MRPELLNPKMMTMLTITNLLIVGKLRSVPAETIATTDVGLLKPTPFSPLVQSINCTLFLRPLRAKPQKTIRRWLRSVKVTRATPVTPPSTLRWPMAYQDRRWRPTPRATDPVSRAPSAEPFANVSPSAPTTTT